MQYSKCCPWQLLVSIFALSKRAYRNLILFMYKKWNESDIRPNWARRTSWGWRDYIFLQTQDWKLKPWRSEAEHATSRLRRLLTILSFTSGWGRNIFVSFKLPRPGNEPRALANHYPRAPSPLHVQAHQTWENALKQRTLLSMFMA